MSRPLAESPSSSLIFLGRSKETLFAGYLALSKVIFGDEQVKPKSICPFLLKTVIKPLLVAVKCFVLPFDFLSSEHPFYIMMNSYLLQRPALDLRDLPLFYSMFNSSTMQVKHMSSLTFLNDFLTKFAIRVIKFTDIRNEKLNLAALPCHVFR